MGYLLLADAHTFVCRTWDDLAARLVSAQEQSYAMPKARGRTAGWTGRCCRRSKRGSWRKPRSLRFARQPDARRRMQTTCITADTDMGDPRKPHIHLRLRSYRRPGGSVLRSVQIYGRGGNSVKRTRF